MRTIITLAAAVSTLAIGAAIDNASAQQAPARGTPSHCTALDQTACTADKGCGWKTAETWTRAEDGKVRATKARCQFSATAAKSVLTQIMSKSR